MKFAFAFLFAVVLAVGCAPVPEEEPKCSGDNCCPTITITTETNEIAGRYHQRGRSGRFFKRSRRFG